MAKTIDVEELLGMKLKWWQRLSLQFYGTKLYKMLYKTFLNRRYM